MPAKHSKDSRISKLEASLKEKVSRISNLESTLQEKISQISDLEKSLQIKASQISNLEAQIHQMQRGIVVQLAKRYQRLVEKLLRSGTRRRYYYELMLTGIRVILNEGWNKFFEETRTWFRLRREIAQSQITRLPKFNATISKREAERLSFPKLSQKPSVSIIIPVYNKWQYTINCLKAVRQGTDGDYEVIVVDDASADETAEILSKVKNLVVLRNRKNAGFIESCNRGIRAGKGKYLLFLNNDTMVTEDWLPPLLAIIDRKDVGAVGSKLIYPDGTLQEAGAIVWRDGSALNYGRGDDQAKPEYNFVREVDYCSGACLLVKRELIEKSKGFDERFKPGYYEDTDLCFAIREMGYKVMYQPKSVVVHFEGVTCGTDMSSGVRKYQTVNQQKFVDKWSSVLQANHEEKRSENILPTRDRRDGKTILAVDNEVPALHKGSGYPRAYSRLKLLAELGYKVTFFPLHYPAPVQPYTSELQQLGIEVFYGANLDFAQFAEARSNNFEVVMVSRPHNMKVVSAAIQKFFPRAVVVYDAEALFSMREILKASVKGAPLKKTAAKKMIDEEIYLMTGADVVITVSEAERRVIMERGKVNDVVVWGHTVEVQVPQTPFSKRKDVLFVGAFPFEGSTNEDAILYFAEEIFPLIRKKLRCRLFIVGANPPQKVKRLSSPSIVVTGFVEDLEEYYEKCCIFVVPHKYSAGISLKLLEAMGHGIPSVVSELTASQLGLTDGKEVLVAKDAGEFAAKVMMLYQDSNLWHQLQRNSLDYIKRECSPESLKVSLKQIIDTACTKINHAPVLSHKI